MGLEKILILRAKSKILTLHATVPATLGLVSSFCGLSKLGFFCNFLLLNQTVVSGVIANRICQQDKETDRFALSENRHSAHFNYLFITLNDQVAS